MKVDARRHTPKGEAADVGVSVLEDEA